MDVRPDRTIAHISRSNSLKDAVEFLHRLGQVIRASEFPGLFDALLDIFHQVFASPGFFGRTVLAVVFHPVRSLPVLGPRAEATARAFCWETFACSALRRSSPETP